ncbi:MAG: EamA family transporter [Syntrophomonas sp.]
MVYLLAIFGMICWGIAPIFAKVGLNNVNPLAGLLLRTIIAAVLVTTWVGVSGSIVMIKNIPHVSWILLAAEAILATVVGDLAYYYAIKHGDVSVVALIMSTSPLITMICAALLLGEPITTWKVIGACYIIFGVVLII